MSKKHSLGRGTRKWKAALVLLPPRGDSPWDPPGLRLGVEGIEIAFPTSFPQGPPSLLCSTQASATEVLTAAGTLGPKRCPLSKGDMKDLEGVTPKLRAQGLYMQG